MNDAGREIILPIVWNIYLSLANLLELLTTIVTNNWIFSINCPKDTRMIEMISFNNLN